jgi:tetratricopeptide (TPR) repeat protein
MGRSRYVAGDVTKARQLFQKAIEQNNTLMEAYDWLVHLDRESGDLVGAQKTLEQAVELSPKSIRRQQELADLALRNGDHATARKAFESAVGLGTHSCFSRVDDHVGLVNAVAETGGPEEALAVFAEITKPRNRGRAVAQEKTYWRLELSYGELLLANERAVEAKDAIAKALTGYREESRDATDPAAIPLAKACYAVGMTQEAQELMDRVIRENHDREDVIAAARGMFVDLGIDGMGDDLIDTARRDVVEINNRGAVLAKEGKIDEAVELLTHASDDLPGNLTISLNALHAILSQIREMGYTNQRQYMINEYLKRAERIDADNPKLAKLREKVSLMQKQAADQQQVRA